MCLLLVLFPKRKPFVCLMHDRGEILRNTRVFLRSVYAMRLLRWKCICTIIFVCIVLWNVSENVKIYFENIKTGIVGVRAPKKENLCMNHRVLLSRCFGKPLVKRPIKSSGAREIKPSRVCALVWCGLRYYGRVYVELGQSKPTCNSSVMATEISFRNSKINSRPNMTWDSRALIL